MKFRYLKTSEGEEFLTVYVPGHEPGVASRETHSNFDHLLSKARDNDESVIYDFELGLSIVRKFDDVALGRVAVRNGQVFFDDDPMDGEVAETILKFVEQGEDFTPLVAFMENVMANPSERSRRELYSWLSHLQFPITDDGHVVGYKAVREGPRSGEGWQSIRAGEAYVNGTLHDGNIPNRIGDVVSMPRSAVDPDSDTACSVGLHVGTWEYAVDFGSYYGDSKVVLVKFNPRDAVSVPRHENFQKIRVCRYEVIGLASGRDDSARYGVVPAQEAQAATTANQGDSTSRRDTRLNYQSQTRDANGRFVRKQ